MRCPAPTGGRGGSGCCPERDESSDRARPARRCPLSAAARGLRPLGGGGEIAAASRPAGSARRGGADRAVAAGRWDAEQPGHGGRRPRGGAAGAAASAAASLRAPRAAGPVPRGPLRGFWPCGPAVCPGLLPPELCGVPALLPAASSLFPARLTPASLPRQGRAPLAPCSAGWPLHVPPAAVLQRPRNRLRGLFPVCALFRPAGCCSRGAARGGCRLSGRCHRRTLFTRHGPVVSVPLWGAGPLAAQRGVRCRRTAWPREVQTARGGGGSPGAAGTERALVRG